MYSSILRSLTVLSPLSNSTVFCTIGTWTLMPVTHSQMKLRTLGLRRNRMVVFLLVCLCAFVRRIISRNIRWVECLSTCFSATFLPFVFISANVFFSICVRTSFAISWRPVVYGKMAEIHLTLCPNWWDSITSVTFGSIFPSRQQHVLSTGWTDVAL